MDFYFYFLCFCVVLYGMWFMSYGLVFVIVAALSYVFVIQSTKYIRSGLDFKPWSLICHTTEVIGIPIMKYVGFESINFLLTSMLVGCCFII